MVTDRNVRQGRLAVVFPRYRDFEEYQRRATTFEFLETATWAMGSTTMTGRGAAFGVVAFPVGGSFFEMLGVKAAMGQTFLSDDKNRGCSVVLAYPFWAGKLGGDAKIVGQSLEVNRQSCIVRGVMPKGFSFYPIATEMWQLVDTPPFRERIPGMNLVFYRALRLTLAALGQSSARPSGSRTSRNTTVFLTWIRHSSPSFYSSALEKYFHGLYCPH